MTKDGTVAHGEWRAFYDFGAALNWVEDIYNTTCYNRMSMVKETDMDRYTYPNEEREWPFTSAMLIIWVGQAQEQRKSWNGGPTRKPTQVELIDIAASANGLYHGKTND